MTFDLAFEAPDDKDVANYLFDTLGQLSSTSDSDSNEKSQIWDASLSSSKSDANGKDQSEALERKGTIKKDIGERAAELLKKSTSRSSKDDEKPKNEIKNDTQAKTSATSNPPAKSLLHSKLITSVDRKTQYKIIAKSHDDLRQEVFCMQLIQFLKDIWDLSKSELLLHPYRILSTSKSTGLLEVVDNANSIDGIKKSINQQRLIEYFRNKFTTEESLASARRNFTRSLAGYSMVCYILSIKDRHNGNIMLCEDGSIVHIDFGFLFGQAPGKDKIPNTNFSMERAEFKVTSEMVEVIGGLESQNWRDYISMMADGLKAARHHKDTLISLVEIMGYKSNFPCFQQPGGGVNRVIRELERRLLPSIHDDDIHLAVTKMTQNSLDNRGTLFYESFQQWSNGISPIY